MSRSILQSAEQSSVSSRSPSPTRRSPSPILQRPGSACRRYGMGRNNSVSFLEQDDEESQESHDERTNEEGVKSCWGKI